MKKIHLPIIIEIDEDGYYIVTCPLFKGCHSYGETIDEALENIKEVIDLCLEEIRNFLSYNQGLNNVIWDYHEKHSSNIECFSRNDRKDGFPLSREWQNKLREWHKSMRLPRFDKSKLAMTEVEEIASGLLPLAMTEIRRRYVCHWFWCTFY